MEDGPNWVSILAATAVFATAKNPHVDRHFFDRTRRALAQRYKQLRVAAAPQSSEALEVACKLFLRTVELFGNALSSIGETLPPKQDVRRANVRQLAGVLQRLQEVLLKIDSAALAQTLHEVDKALNDGVAQDATDPVAAYVAASHLRLLAGEPLSAAIVATTNAARLLAEPDYDPTLQVIWRLERLFDEHDLVFEVKDSGFAGDCLRAMFELANPSKPLDRPKYLLSKAVNDPRSWASKRAGVNKKLL